MNEFPYMPMYWNDLLSDNKVRSMSNAELGSYVRLLGAAWQEDEPGTLPANEEDLARFAGLDLPAWRSISARVLSCFSPCRNATAIGQKRMMSEFKKLRERSVKRKSAGKKGNLKRWKRDSCGPSQGDNLARSMRFAKQSQSDNHRVSKDTLVPGLQVEVPAELKEVAGFQESWELFCTYRLQIKKPFTAVGASRMLVKLAKRPTKAASGVEMAIDKGWQGFEWTWFDNTIKDSRYNPVTETPDSDLAGYQNACMAWKTEFGTAPFGKPPEEVVEWFYNRPAQRRTA